MMKLFGGVLEAIGCMVVTVIIGMILFGHVYGVTIKGVDLKEAEIICTVEDKNLIATVDLKEMEISYKPDVKGYFEELIGR